MSTGVKDCILMTVLTRPAAHYKLHVLNPSPPIPPNHPPKHPQNDRYTYTEIVTGMRYYQQKTPKRGGADADALPPALGTPEERFGPLISEVGERDSVSFFMPFKKLIWGAAAVFGVFLLLGHFAPFLVDRTTPSRSKHFVLGRTLPPQALAPEAEAPAPKAKGKERKRAEDAMPDVQVVRKQRGFVIFPC